MSFVSVQIFLRLDRRYEFVALMYSCTSSICPILLCKMIATLDCVHASHYLWLFNADLCNSKYHLEINFENLPPKVNKQDKDLWTQYIYTLGQ